MINTELNSIKIDAESGLQRDIRHALPEKWVKPYQDGIIGRYDTHTIFYDVFLLDDCQTVVAIGPPLLNLHKTLLPATLSIDGRTLTFRTKTNHKKLLVLTAFLPTKLPENSLPDTQISFANGLSKTICLRSPTPLQGNMLITIQKNNKIKWIKDWITYYRDQFDIQHVVIYDNDSSNQKALIEKLRGIAIVIPWPFPFGIAYRSGNKFCQVGALNHLKIRYARNSLIFNFDIDELLVCKTEQAKRAILSARQVRFDSFFVPYTSTVKENYSFSDFKKRSATARNEAYKYIVHSDIPGIMNPHYFHAELGFWHRFLPDSFSRGPVIPVADAYFLHYTGITTNWKKHYVARLSENAEQPKNTIDDFSVIDVFSSLQTPNAPGNADDK